MNVEFAERPWTQQCLNAPVSHDRGDGYFAAGDVTRQTSPLALVSKFVDFRNSSFLLKNQSGDTKNGQQRERKGSNGLNGWGRKENEVVAVVFRIAVWVSITVSFS